MRDKFFKWLKRFFVVLPLISLIICSIWQFTYSRNEANQSSPLDASCDPIGYFIMQMYENSSNPLVEGAFYSEDNSSIVYNVYNGIYTVAYDLTGLDGIDYGDASYYVFAVVNFLSWWVFVELIFLFFRFVTFLISWVNSLFDKCFNKINKG